MNKRAAFLSCLILSLLFFTAFSSPCRGDENDEAIKRSERYMKASGLFVKAVECMNSFELDKAEKLYGEAAEIYSELGCKKDLFLIYQLLTGIKVQKGEYESALEMIDKRRDLLASLKDPAMEMSELFSQAVVYFSMGDMKKTIECLEKERSIAESQNNADEMIKCDSMLAHIETYLQEFKSAARRLDQASSYLSRVSKVNLLNYYTQYGYMELNSGNYQKAIDRYGKALACCGDGSLKASTAPEILLRMAEAYGGLKQDGEMKRCYREALEIVKADRSPSMIDMPEHFKVLAVCNLALGNKAEADRACRQLDGCPATVSRYTCWHYYDIAQAYEKAGLPEKACEYYKKAINILEDVLSLMKEGRSAVTLFEGKVLYLYEHLIDILHKMKKDDEAYLYVERSRSRALLGMLASGGVGISKGVSAEDFDEENRLSQDICRIQAALDKQAAAQPNADGSAFAGKLAELEKLRKSYAALMKKIELSNSEYVDLKSVKPSSLSEIQKQIPEGAVLLEYFIGRRSGFLFVIDSRGMKVHELKIGGEKLKELVIEALQSIADSGEAPDEAKKDLAQLYSVLIEPAKAGIEGKKMLIVVPHRWLHVVPFAALVDGSGAWLVERYQVVQEPSASAMKLCLDKKRSGEKGFKGFAIGNMVTKNAGSTLSPLPETLTEVDSIGSLYPGNELVKEKAMTLNTLKDKAGKARYLHIATHGITDSAFPRVSRLIMADRGLLVAEIFNIPMDADLVTLSACRTGLGKITEGDEVVGLSRAFFYAGTPSLIVSMWSVSDESTAELMREFYNNLVKGNTKAEALREAELAVMKKRPSPFYWAPFVLLGDWK